MSVCIVNAPIGVALATLAWVASSAPAAAQAVAPAPAASAVSGLAADLEHDVACADGRTLPDLRTRLLMASTFSPIEIGRALAILAASPTACAPLKSAALALGDAYPDPAASSVPSFAEAPPSTPPVSVGETPELAAEALKFVVGPPPRRMTRDRTGGG